MLSTYQYITKQLFILIINMMFTLDVNIMLITYNRI